MCFSEQASFSAAALLGIMSIVCFKTVRNNVKLYALASIPLFFAIQQAAEGFEWLYFKGIYGNAEIASASKNIFAFFAFIFWPLWLPISLYLAEKEPNRKLILTFFIIGGLGYALYSGRQTHTEYLNSKPVNHSIQYETPLTEALLWPYLILVFTPWFISSLPRMAWAGTAYIMSALFAAYIYNENFISVWCFFAAIVSLFLIITLRTCPDREQTTN